MKEKSQNGDLIADLLEAASKEDWETVDEEIIPKLAKADGDMATRRLLEYVDETPDIRDAVATGLAVLRIKDRKVRKKAIEAMIKMATSDEEMFPSGRAAVFLLKNRRYVNLVGPAINDAIEYFKERAEEKDWVDGLCENIPRLRKFLDK